MIKTTIHIISIMVLFLFGGFIDHSEANQKLSIVQSPKELASESVDSSGNIEIRVIGTDSFIEGDEYKPRILLIPQKDWLSRDKESSLDRYFVAESSHLLIKGIKPGEYVIGIESPYEMKMIFRGVQPQPNPYRRPSLFRYL